MYTTEFQHNHVRNNSQVAIYEIQTMNRSQYRTMMRDKKRKRFIRRVEYFVAAMLVGFILSFAIYTNLAYHAQEEKINNTYREMTATMYTDLSEETIYVHETEPVAATTMAVQYEDTTTAVQETPTFHAYDLPSVYYGDIDFSTFQPYMDYQMVTDTTSSSYQVCSSENIYIDDEGLCRYALDEEQFSINGQDDYVIALGTFYKEKGKCGQRYLIHTTNGYYTATAGDEKADVHTDEHHMFVRHGEQGEYAGMIEFLVDSDKLTSAIQNMGTVTASTNPILQGEILGVYEIEED